MPQIHETRNFSQVNQRKNLRVSLILPHPVKGINTGSSPNPFVILSSSTDSAPPAYQWSNISLSLWGDVFSPLVCGPPFFTLELFVS
jgi:hypothetical protein